MLGVFFIKKPNKNQPDYFFRKLGVFGDVLRQTVNYFRGRSFSQFFDSSLGELQRPVGIGKYGENKILAYRQKVLPKAIAASALFVGIAYVGAVGAGGKEFFISQSAFEKIISPVINMKIVQNFCRGLIFLCRSANWRKI